MSHYCHVKLVAIGSSKRVIFDHKRTKKLRKIAVFPTFAVNSSKNNRGKLLICLLKQLYILSNFHIIFDDDRSMLSCVFIPLNFNNNAKKMPLCVLSCLYQA